MVLVLGVVPLNELMMYKRANLSLTFFFLPFFGFVSGLFLFRCLGIHAVWGLGTWPGFGFGFGFGLSGLDYHN